MASGTKEGRNPLRDKEKNRRRQAEPTVGEPEAAIYRGIGERLRARRVEAGLNLEDVVRELNIRLPHLVALEEGRFEDLPGRIYASGFLRNYAEHLGIEADAVLKAFKDETTAPEQTPLIFPVPPPQSRVPRGWIMLIALVIAAGVYGGWYYTNHRDRFYAPRVPKPPQASLVLPKAAAPAPVRPAAKPAAVAAAASSSAPKQAAPTVTAGSAPAPAATEPAKTTPAVTDTSHSETAPDAKTAEASSPKAAPAPSTVETAATSNSGSPAAAGSAAGGAMSAKPASSSEAGETSGKTAGAGTEQQATSAGLGTGTSSAAMSSAKAGEAAASAPAGRVPKVYGSDSPNVVVVLTAHSDAWLTVSAADHKVLFPGHILQPGDSYRVPPDHPHATLWTGNLGGLEITVDGKRLPKVGTIGQSAKNIPLDPNDLVAYVHKLNR